MDRCLFNDLSRVILQACGKCCQPIDNKSEGKLCCHPDRDSEDCMTSTTRMTSECKMMTVSFPLVPRGHMS